MIKPTVFRTFVAATLMGSGAIALAGPFAPVLPVDARSIALPSSPALAFRGGVAMRPPFDAFGGISGIAVEGDDLIAVSDRGHWLRVSPVVKEGRLVDVDHATHAPLLNDAGVLLGKGGQDAEDLTPGGWVSFEGDHRIARYAVPGGAAVETLRNPNWRVLRSNGGLEALARDDQSHLWAIAERSGSETTPFPVFIWDGAIWRETTLPRTDKYAVTSAAFAPDGSLYIIERRFGFLTGFRTRIRRVEWALDLTILRDEILLSFGPTADNLEAIAFWEIDGRTHLVLASDDNFQPLQRNILALYEVL